MLLRWLKAVVDWIFRDRSSVIQLSLEAPLRRNALRHQRRWPDPPNRPYEPYTGIRVPKWHGPTSRSASAAVAEPDDDEGAVAIAGRKSAGIVVNRHDRSLTLAKKIDDSVYPEVARLGGLANEARLLAEGSSNNWSPITDFLAGSHRSLTF
jgi:hypothetical protein